MQNTTAYRVSWKHQELLQALLCLQFHPGVGVGLGNDYTLYALKEGIVAFKKSKYINSVSLQAFICLGSSDVCRGRKCLLLALEAKSDLTLQVSVIDVEAYEVPAGNQLKEGSRKMRRREMYTPRSQQRQAAAAAVPAAVPV